jgi:Tfp pilus assembly protein PilX
MSSNSKKKGIIYQRGGQGVALVTAILAMMILMALGFLAISVTTGDLKITSRVVGEKKALIAAETGIHRLMQNFDGDNPTGARVTNAQVNAAADPNSRYTINSIISPPRAGPATRSRAGFAIGGGQNWGQKCFDGSVTGVNTNYNSSVTIDVGIGYLNSGGDTMSR